MHAALRSAVLRCAVLSHAALHWPRGMQTMPPQQSASVAHEAPCSVPPAPAGQPARVGGPRKPGWWPGRWSNNCLA